ncbi:hypothetical protein Mal15_27190 [Stieleria maiorica]|uniref:Uncharacterized protein n=1 Tax=Stieleria maiorica TaxID=2795974 RepID=A0A5B9MGF8_9BACT|nr:hypothetical protein [Stieleria maiorica]QEF98664.1 hypothetical protein Mal15_27190 [Stieleria maiorica]
MRRLLGLIFACTFIGQAFAETGDPQIRTDHPWYPGELAISTFDRLFQTQAEVYRRVTGRPVETDEDQALASWLWRNTHYWHAEAGRRDLWGDGFESQHDLRLREYWNGLFGFGFGLCGTTHSQWTAEFEHRLGHGRARGVGASAHNAFEVFLTGGAYRDGRWALVDHDLSTVIFDPSGTRLMGLGEIQAEVDRLIDRNYLPQRQRGWLVCGLHPDDGNSYRRYAVAEYLAGYAGPPPMIALRRGESFRRYFQPGLEDGKTFVFWGRNYNADGIPGPHRSRTWVNQPDLMHGSTSGTAHRDGQVRYANVVSIYRPDFSTVDYREGIVQESADELVFEFQTPYVIGASPPSDDAWGIYQPGCTGGLVLRGNLDCPVAVSCDAGRTWSTEHTFVDGLDLTDLVKGRSNYWVRFAADRSDLLDSGLEIRTVCQANVAVLPRLKDNGTTVSFASSGRRVRSLGPEIDLAKSFVAEGGFGETTVSLEVRSDRPVVQVYAAAHVASGSPPDPTVRYQIDFSVDGGKQFQPIVKDWTVPRRGNEPSDFWSQSFCYGSADVSDPARNLQIRFHNSGGKRYLRAEAHLIEKTNSDDPVRVTYDWVDSSGGHQQSHVFEGVGTWKLDTAQEVRTRWVEFATVP